MDKNSADHVRWFLGEIPRLREEKLLADGDAAKLDAHYRERLEASAGALREGNRKLVLSLISVIADSRNPPDTTKPAGFLRQALFCLDWIWFINR